MRHILFLILFFISSCSLPSQQLNTSTLYKKDVVFWVGDRKIVGIGVAPLSETYKMFFQFNKGNIDFLTLTTCHRSTQVENKEHGYNYLFSPTALEKESSCPLDIGIYDKKGRHGWGYLLFEKPSNTLEAILECNGETIVGKGVSICQGQIGTVQRINFKTEVKGVASDGCEFHQDGRNFEFEVAKNFCYFSFADRGGDLHDLTVYGYETFIIRE